ncbi:MAG TPA: hypothetical protein VHN78_09145, partial [Chloroflexota bacterium]|nr:hypothetical protein [Chloroflexota bacterium]
GVRPGEQLVLSFLPPSFVAGAWLGVLGLVVCGFLVWLDYRAARWRRRLAQGAGVKRLVLPPVGPRLSADGVGELSRR